MPLKDSPLRIHRYDSNITVFTRSCVETHVWTLCARCLRRVRDHGPTLSVETYVHQEHRQECLCHATH